MRIGSRRGGGRRLATGVLAAVLASLTWLTPVEPASAAPPACADDRNTYNNQLSDTPWPLRRLRPDLAWPLSDGAGTVVAVIDSGVSADPPSLAGKVMDGKDFIDPAAIGRCDEAAHGTLVAGLIAGRQLPNSPFTGIAPKASILPIRVLRTSERTVDPSIPANIAAAVVEATVRGAHVINMSLTTQPNPALYDAIRFAVSKNVVVVAAAGNESGNGGGSSGPVYPAAYEEVIAVAGIDQQEHHVPTSVAGPHVDVAAPGFSIDGPMPRGGGYAQFKAGGTSFAAGYVSGLAALIRAQDPQLTPGQVARRITATADHPPEGRNDQVGYGVINPYRALAAVTGGSTKPPNAGLLDRPERPVDPLAGTKRTAAILTGALLALTLLFVTGAWLMRRARSIRPDATPRFPRHRRPGPLAFTPNRAT